MFVKVPCEAVGVPFTLIPIHSLYSVIIWLLSPNTLKQEKFWERNTEFCMSSFPPFSTTIPVFEEKPSIASCMVKVAPFGTVIVLLIICVPVKSNCVCGLPMGIMAVPAKV